MSDRRSDLEPLYRHIVVGLDGSDSATAALVHASRLSEVFDARLTVVTVWSYPIGYDGFMSGIDLERESQVAAQAIVDATVPEAQRERIRVVSRAGAPAHELIDESASADLLIVGSRGRGGFVGLVLGSVSTQCAAHASCPVLIHHAK